MFSRIGNWTKIEIRNNRVHTKRFIAEMDEMVQVVPVKNSKEAFSKLPSETFDCVVGIIRCRGWTVLGLLRRYGRPATGVRLRA